MAHLNVLQWLAARGLRTNNDHEQRITRDMYMAMVEGVLPAAGNLNNAIAAMDIEDDDDDGGGGGGGEVGQNALDLVRQFVGPRHCGKTFSLALAVVASARFHALEGHAASAMVFSGGHRAALLLVNLIRRMLLLLRTQQAVTLDLSTGAELRFRFTDPEAAAAAMNAGHNAGVAHHVYAPQLMRNVNAVAPVYILFDDVRLDQIPPALTFELMVPLLAIQNTRALRVSTPAAAE